MMRRGQYQVCRRRRTNGLTEGEGALAPQTEWSMVDELLRESMRGLEVDIDRLILLGRKM